MNNSWEPAENILCNDLISKYEREQQGKKPVKATKVEKPTKTAKVARASRSTKAAKAAEEPEELEERESAKDTYVKESDESKENEDDGSEHNGKDDVEMNVQDEEAEMSDEVDEPEKTEEAKKDDEAQEPELIDFTKAKQLKVINESSSTKSITLQGTYLNKPLVVKLDKTTFNETSVKRAVCDKKLESDRDFFNDVYSTYTFKPSTVDLNELRATVVWPAGDSAIEKYSKSEKVFISETPETYTKVVEPFIEAKVTKEKDYNQWIYNILDGKAEKERVILNDKDPASGFILELDLKWDNDEKNPSVLAICHRRDIRSLRDLDDSHLTLLKNIMTKGTKAIKDKFKKMKGQLRSYVHYQPTFYHFHVHFKVVDLNDYEATDRDNLLSNIINNISMNKDYYKKATLTYPLAVSSPLYKELKKAKKV